MNRLHNILDALSQLVNCVVLPRAADTNANESVSGRAHREGWKKTERTINLLFFWDRPHCENAFKRDVDRAYKLVQQSLDAEEMKGL